MPIQSGDVKLVRSAVRADVPTGSVIPEGASNAIVPDISELDRSGGRVNAWSSTIQSGPIRRITKLPLMRLTLQHCRLHKCRRHDPEDLA
jgi:hypothetical protein